MRYTIYNEYKLRLKTVNEASKTVETQKQLGQNLVNKKNSY